MLSSLRPLFHSDASKNAVQKPKAPLFLGLRWLRCAADGLLEIGEAVVCTGRQSALQWLGTVPLVDWPFPQIRELKSHPSLASLAEGCGPCRLFGNR